CSRDGHGRAGRKRRAAAVRPQLECGSGGDPMSSARQKFTEFKGRSGAIPDAELDGFWETLAPTTINGLIGEWKDNEIDYEHKMNGQQQKARWFGKTFKSVDDVQPLVCLDDDGNKFSNVAMGKGEASLWLEDFRGEITATMVYDGQPVHD